MSVFIREETLVDARCDACGMYRTCIAIETDIEIVALCLQDATSMLSALAQAVDGLLRDEHPG